jgi:hypothetical protein
MTRFAGPFLICVLAVASGCSAPGQTKTEAEAASQAATTQAPPEIQAVAATLLGSGAAVLAFGDLAHNGRDQAFVADRLVDAPESGGQGASFTRAAILQREGTKWSEVLRCDEYLKNPAGYLGGAPVAPTTGWRVEFDRSGKDKGREFLFTPLRAAGETPMSTITVRWNPSVNRYQALDHENGHFLGEAPSLETPTSPLR